jgi:hypothetical protein
MTGSRHHFLLSERWVQGTDGRASSACVSGRTRSKVQGFFA